MIREKLFSFICLILVLIFHLINNYIIISEDKLPLFGEEVAYFESSLGIHKFITSNFFQRDYKSLKSLYQKYLDTGEGQRPPLFMLTMPLFFNFFGLTPDDSAAISNILYFVILMFSVYGIGKVLFNRNIGIFAAFIVSMFPAVFGMSRQILVDFALMSVVSLTLYLMLHTDNFRNRKYAVLFGLSIGIGFLTKMTYPIFVAAPVIYYWFISLRRSAIDNSAYKNMKINLCISLFIGLLFASSWYLPNLFILLRRAVFCSTYTHFFAEFKFLPWFIYQVSFYIRSLIDNCLFPIYFSLFFISLIFLLADFSKEKKFIFLWFLIPLLFFSISTNKNPRYILPILPAIGLIVASEVIYLGKNMSIAIIIFSFFHYFAISYLPIINSKFANTCYRSDSGLLYASKANWKTKEIIDIINLGRKNRDTKVSLLSIPLINEVHLSIRYIARSKEMNIEVDCPMYFDKFNAPEFIDYDAKVLAADFIITKTGNLGGFGLWRDGVTQLDRVFKRYKYNFALIGTVDNLPDSSSVLIFKNKIKNI